MRKFGKLLIAVGVIAGVALSSGCKSDCEKAYDHAISLMEKEKDMPKEVLEKLKSEDEKKKMIEDCKKQPAEEVKCFLDAKSMEDAMKCNKKEEKK